MELPSLPIDIQSIVPHLNKAANQGELRKAIEPFKEYETKLRQIFAQEPQHEATKHDHLVPVFENEQLSIKARDFKAESDDDKEKYILALADSKRRKQGAPATVTNIKDFRTNFNLFSEQSLVDLDWSNIVAAGSSVVTPLLPVDAPHNKSKRALRAYYHEELAPASDVDLFIYGLNEEQAIEKIKQIESRIRDSVLSETTTIRTKNAITIVSEYPTRHVQIVLRLYKNVTEILTGFDVDCACVAYDGKQVWAAPRALAAFATQQNSIDLTRRSPSYENRLSKYSHRGFEVYWPSIDRDRIDPTIYERSFSRVVGLARLLVLEKLPHPSDRDSYADKRRRERGRPELPWNTRYRHALPGNVKDAQPDDVPDWLEEDDQSDYHTFTIPYGPRYNAKRIEKLLFKQDLLLNAEWNRPDDRETELHRHPAFFGSVEDVIQDCCGFCPTPTTDEDLEAHEEESKRYISGELHFMKDDPGRQAIGSFNPLTADDWTDMAYLGSSPRLCQAIVDNDIQAVRDWLEEEGADVNRRDHTGRTPLQVACMCSTPEIVQLLIDRGARIVSRIYNGMTALHMAAHRGNTEIVKLLLDKSEENEKDEERKDEARKEARRAAAKSNDDSDVDMSQADDEDIEMVDDEDDSGSDRDDDMTEGSFVKVKEDQAEDEEDDERDVYDVDVVAWDNPVSALHLAIMAGHIDVINTLIETYGADVMLPVKLKEEYSGPQAILNLVLPIQLSSENANETIHTLLRHGASPAQADTKQITNLHYLVIEAKMKILDILNDKSGEATRRAVNHLVVGGWQSSPDFQSPLLSAIRLNKPELIQKVLELGANPTIEFEQFAKAYTQKFDNVEKDPDQLKKQHLTFLNQPIIEAAQFRQLSDIVALFVDRGVDVNTMTKAAYELAQGKPTYGNDTKSLLEMVRERIKELDEYKSEDSEPPQKPDALPAFKDTGSSRYESWILKSNYAQAEAIHKEHIKAYETDMKEYQNRSTKGIAEKEKAVRDTLAKWQALEKKLVSKGAKTFKELHPDAEDQGDPYNGYNYKVGKSGQDKDKPFNNKVSFQVPDLNDKKREQYLRLFEAVYNGDEDTVKDLCLNEDAPLQIAVQDSANFSPFSLAVVRGHYKLGITILDIAAAQYQPSKEEEKSYRYSINRPEVDDGDYNSEIDFGSEDGDSVKLYRELVNEKYTIDDIRELSDNVKSRVSPQALFGWDCELWRGLSTNIQEAKAAFRPQPTQRHFYPYYDDDKHPWAWFYEMNSRERQRNSFSLYRYAIVQDDKMLMEFLLGLERDLVYKKDGSETVQKLQMSSTEFDLALALGHTDLIGEIIRRTGTLLPLANLVKRSGIELDEKPEYYQGLSVYGQKRKDWAQQDRGQRDKYNADHGSPLLAAIMSGNIKTVEYFLSDTPLRCYEEFTKTYENDKLIQALARSEGGIERALHTWMDTRSNLAIHISVMADPKVSKPVRDFLLKRMPQYINVKSRNGSSPLYLALQYGHSEAVRELIKAGADQSARNKARENILHIIYTHRDDPLDPKSLRELIGMLKPEVVASLTLQRKSGDGADAMTPLMNFLQSGHLDGKDLRVLDAMLEISGEKDLEIMNGAGDYPLHTLVRQGGNLEIVKYIAEKRPDLLMKENATGMTPLEIAENDLLRAVMDNPPTLSNRARSHDILSVAAENFADKPESDEQSGGTTSMYRTLLDIANRHPQRRGLVSLMDANETARRLADQQQKQNEEMKRREARGLKSYTGYGTGDGDGQDNEPEDEVTLWSSMAYNLRSISAASE